MKRIVTFIWSIFSNSGLWIKSLVALLLFIYLIFSLSGFFNSPFWIASLPLMICTVIGRSAHYLHQKMEQTGTRLDAKEALGIVLKHLRGSILYTLIPAIFFFFIYYILQEQGDIVSIALLGCVILGFIMCGLYFLKGEISWLWYIVTWRWQASKNMQGPPLQQHIYKHL